MLSLTPSLSPSLTPSILFVNTAFFTDKSSILGDYSEWAMCEYQARSYSVRVPNSIETGATDTEIFGIQSEEILRGVFEILSKGEERRSLSCLVKRPKTRIKVKCFLNTDCWDSSYKALNQERHASLIEIINGVFDQLFPNTMTESILAQSRLSTDFTHFLPILPIERTTVPLSLLPVGLTPVDEGQETSMQSIIFRDVGVPAGGWEELSDCISLATCNYRKKTYSIDIPISLAEHVKVAVGAVQLQSIMVLGKIFDQDGACWSWREHAESCLHIMLKKSASKIRLLFLLNSGLNSAYILNEGRAAVREGVNALFKQVFPNL